jgi:acyl-CoA thioesterase-2
MPHSARDISALLDLEPEDELTYLGGHQPATSLAKIYGGQLFAQGIVAAERTVPAGRVAHSAQAQFLEAGRHDIPVRYRVEHVRDGRSFSTRRVSGFQGDRRVVDLNVSFHVPEPGVEHQREMPGTKPPIELPELTQVMESASSLPHLPWRREWAGLDVRYVPDNLQAVSGPDPAIQQVWMRTRDRLADSRALHRHVIAYLSDHLLLAAALLPHGLMLGDRDLPRATLNHSIWFHDDARADEWLFIDQHSPWAGGGRGLSFASVYTEDGRLVASLAQEGLIRATGRLRDELGISRTDVLP